MGNVVDNVPVNTFIQYYVPSLGSNIVFPLEKYECMCIDEYIATGISKYYPYNNNKFTILRDKNKRLLIKICGKDCGKDWSSETIIFTSYDISSGKWT
jgi:hypothetical protein